MKSAAKRALRDEKGQALLITLLFLVIGSLIITPTLNLMGAGIKGGHVYEQKIDEIYAADSGVEDAMWNIRYDTMDELLASVGYNPYDYSTAYDYPYDLDINSKNVSVAIQNIWIPNNIDAPTDPSVPEQIIDDEKLMIIGYPGGSESTYTIKIVFNWANTSERDSLKVKTIGVWLCPGFDYDGLVDGNQLPSPYTSSVVANKGGSALVWDFGSGTTLTSFPTPETSERSPMVKTITFKYKAPVAGQIPELVSSWVDTTGIPGKTYTYTWDDNIRLYKITSQAGTVSVEAYGAKTRFRKLKSSISGNYFGTGNSLIGGNLNPPDNYHYQLYGSTEATVPTNDDDATLGIPTEAKFEAAYLYWTGWIDWNMYNPLPSGSETRYPSGDISRGGDWDKTTSMYSYVDEVGEHDGDASYLLTETSGWWDSSYVLFAFPSFSVSVPLGEEITGLTVSLVARDNTSGGNNMRPAIRVGGSNYLTVSSSQEVQTSYSTISYTYRTNPRTGQRWTANDINGIGSNALQGFGVYSRDADPKIRLTQVYARVEWGPTLRYPDDPTEEELDILVEERARLDKVLFNNTEITADKWRTLYPSQFQSNHNYQGTWFYTCKADVTDLLKQWIDSEIVDSNGAGTYTFGHIAAPNEEDPSYSFSFVEGGSTGYPLGTPSPNPPTNTRYTAAHAGWSLLILYSSAGTLRNQFYLYDIDTPGFSFFFGWQSSTVDWDNDGNPGGTISGFLVPPQNLDETLAARVTVFVGEGDKGYTGDYFKVNRVALDDGTGYSSNNVWNSNSRGLTVEGVDIDHFDITWASDILHPYDASALIEVPTGTDGFTMSYMLLLFRSELGPGGVITNYAIKL
jgi:hypothetical protein